MRGIAQPLCLKHNLQLLRHLDVLVATGYPVMLGASRKRFIGELTGEDTPARRVSGTVAACLAAWRRGATIFRVHDVAALVQALTVTAAIEKPSSEPKTGA